MRAWGVFCNLWRLPLSLWSASDEGVSRAQARKAEWQLLAFCVWLHEDGYATSTCINYVGAVKDWHQSATRMPAAYWGLVMYRMPTLFKAIKRRNPAKIRDKRPWEFEYSLAVARGWRVGARWQFGSGVEGHLRLVTWTVICVAFEQLMRLAELVTTKPPSVSMRRPLKWSDVVYEDAEGNTLGYDREGRPVGVPVMAKMREPPSKTRPGGEWLLLPFPEGWQRGESPSAAGPMIWHMQCAAPVPRNRAGEVPLFGMSAWSATHPIVIQISQHKFVSVMHQLCNGASPVIRYKVGGNLGLHCFRVGGANRLIDIGASAPQVMAAGRWMGDCWTLYARRQRAVLVELTCRMSDVKKALLKRSREERGRDKERASERKFCASSQRRYSGQPKF
jgi:hypothetical protein